MEFIHLFPINQPIAFISLPYIGILDLYNLEALADNYYDLGIRTWFSISRV